MLTVFMDSARERRCRGWPASVSFFVTEALGLIAGAAVEWRAKWSSRDYLVVRESSQTGQAAIPAEIREAEQHLEVKLRQMVDAIAHHRFQQSRLFSNAEREARENLRTLRERYNFRDASAA